MNLGSLISEPALSVIRQYCLPNATRRHTSPMLYTEYHAEEKCPSKCSAFMAFNLKPSEACSCVGSQLFCCLSPPILHRSLFRPSSLTFLLGIYSWLCILALSPLASNIADALIMALTRSLLALTTTLTSFSLETPALLIGNKIV